MKRARGRKRKRERGWDEESQREVRGERRGNRMKTAKVVGGRGRVTGEKDEDSQREGRGREKGEKE